MSTELRQDMTSPTQVNTNRSWIGDTEIDEVREQA